MEIREPGYIALYKSGELAQRAEGLQARLNNCDICPRACGVNRLQGERGFCHSGYLPIVSSFCAHHGEEPSLSGTRGSGTIFFGNCNMRCIYCQNYQISQNWINQQENEIPVQALAEKMLYIQNELKCHNINLVSPSHFVPQIIGALMEAIPEGLHLPLVYNSSGYDSVETIKELDGIISVYLPDLRYSSDNYARRYSLAPHYVENARAAIKQMYAQTGDVKFDKSEIAYHGVIVRLLILPNELSGTRDSLEFLAKEVSPTVTVSVMSQYYPAHKALRVPLLSRKISVAEYAEVVNLLNTLGMGNGWLQEMDSAEYYQPDFTRKGHPFESTGDNTRTA